jgi:hypothetical protein
MPLYVIVDDTLRTAGVALTPRCYKGLLEAGGKKRAAVLCPPHHSLITLSTLPKKEQRKICHSLGYKVTICANVIVPRENFYGGRRPGAGRKPFSDSDRPTCCDRPTNRHSGGRWRCPVCKALSRTPIKSVDNQV